MIEKPDRRWFLRAAAGATCVIGGVTYILASDSEAEAARKQKRADGRPRLPPGQRLIKQLRPMGGVEGDPRATAFRLKIHGLVASPKTIDFAGLVKLPRQRQKADVHCVTAWSCLDQEFDGVRISDILAAAGGVKKGARHVILEAAHGYTANITLAEAMKPNVLVAFRHNRKPFERRHGAPVRAIVPNLYFWKSAKWLTGVKVVDIDEPGYWEVRGYHNYADPWKQQRYA